MLYLNGKYFDVNDINGENKEHVKDYRDKVAKLRENYGRWLLVKTKDKDVKNPSGLLEPKKTITVPLVCTIGGRNGTEEWAYSENAASVKDGQVLLDTRQLLVRFGEYMLDMDATPDLAYFLTEKHVFFKNGKLHIHDERSLAKVEADERRLRARLESSIYNDTSHLNVNRGMLEMVCKRWGVSDVQKKSKDQLQNQLYDKVLEADARYKKSRQGRNINDFLEDIKVTDNTKLGALVYEAIEKGVIAFNSRYLQWEVNIYEGEKPILTSVPTSDIGSKEEVLIDAVITDVRVRAILERALGKSSEDPETVYSFDVEEVKLTDDYRLMQKMGAQLGIKVTGIPKEELREAIIHALHEHQTK